MIRVTFLLADDQRPPFRQLWEGDLPTVPEAGEPIQFGGRGYRVLERAWRFGTEGPVTPPQTVGAIIMGCGVLVTQISGPAHVVVAPSSVQ